MSVTNPIEEDVFERTMGNEDEEKKYEKNSREEDEEKRRRRRRRLYFLNEKKMGQKLEPKTIVLLEQPDTSDNLRRDCISIEIVREDWPSEDAERERTERLCF